MLSWWVSADLKGLKVSHDATDFVANSNTILTLADSRILAEDGEDVLENVNMAEYERTAEYLDKKKKAKQVGRHGVMEYRPWEEEELELEEYKKNGGVLSKYDNFVFDGDEGLVGKQKEKREGFTIGNTTKVQREEERVEDDDVVRLGNVPKKVDRKLLEVNYDKHFHDDYLKEGDVGFKKPKKKKTRSTRVKTEADEAVPSTSGDVEMALAPAPIVRKNFDEENLVDDDDLQTSLARQRRMRNKSRLKARKPSDDDVAMENGTPAAPHAGDQPIVKTEEAEMLVRPDEEEEEETVTGGGLVFDDTSDFIGRVGKAEPPPITRRLPPPAKRSSVPPVATKEGDNSVPAAVEVEDVPMVEVEEGEVSGDEDGDVEMNRLMNDGVKKEEEEDIKKEDDDAHIGTAGEQLVSNGMAATLGLLRNQGLIKALTPEQIERDRAQRAREMWTLEQRKLDEERELQRLAAKAAGNTKDQHQREIENRLREQERARKQAEMFRDYKPVVDIKYHDEFGRDMNQKEAWKALSHKFHGKSSGKMKTEKRLKKIEEEKKREAMASGDTPLSTAAAFAARQEKTGKAIMVLSVGNKQSAPQAEQTLPSNLNKPSTSQSKASTSKSAKAKSQAAKEPPILTNLNPPITSLRAPSASASASASPAPGSGTASPAVLAFKPAAVSKAVSKKPVDTVTGEKLKIGLKRKEPDTGREAIEERQRKR
ncbi:hypothetical protein BT69DRAFT_269209 [Atractiella rhizophila]|nr:hypothetical protein BT69DRAFT_269209 [Atractiella rhizophila]